MPDATNPAPPPGGPGQTASVDHPIADMRPGEWFELTGAAIPAYLTMGDDGGVWLVTDVDTTPEYTLMAVKTFTEDAPRPVPDREQAPYPRQVPPPLPVVKPPDIPAPGAPVLPPPVGTLGRLGPLIIKHYPDRDVYLVNVGGPG